MGYYVVYDKVSLLAGAMSIEKPEDVAETNYVYVEGIPDYIEQEGKIGLLYLNAEKTALEYRYKDIPKDTEQIEYENLKKELDDLRLVVAEFIGGEK